MKLKRHIRHISAITILLFLFTAVVPAGALVSASELQTLTVSAQETAASDQESQGTWQKVKSKIKDAVEGIKGDGESKIDIPRGLQNFIDNVKEKLPDKWAGKIDEKQSYYQNEDNLKKETAIKTAAFVASKAIGGVCAGIGALIGVASGNPLGVGMGAYVGWRVGSTMGGVVSKYAARALIEETWDKSDPDYEVALSNLKWGRITSEGLAATGGSLAGEVLGAYIGATAGAALGTFTFPIVGTVGGAVVGRWVGKKLLTPLFKFIATKVTSKVYDASESTSSSVQAAQSEAPLTESAPSSQAGLSELADLEDQFASLTERYQLLLAESRSEEASQLYSESIAPVVARIRELRASLVQEQQEEGVSEGY